jgi:phenylacetate-coenzyme A ligase PaaK-like adenylate-forming protein
MMEHMRSSGPGRAERFLGLSVLTPLPEMVRRLNDFQPAVLGGYASTLLLLAEEQEAGRLHIDPVMVVSGGESLAPKARKLVAAAFGCPVRDYYGTSEATGLTFDCEEGWLHLNADWFVLEAVDENHQPTPPGETSHTVLLTNLANRLQPLIRYDLGDRISFKEGPCPCGSPLPAFWVEGRRNELLSFPADDDRGEVKLPPRALSTVIDFAPGVRRCQAIKSSPRSLKVRIEVEGGREEGEVWKEVRRRLKGYLSTQGLSKVGVERDGEKPSIDERTGKFRHVWSEVEGEGVGAEAIRW